MKKQEMMMPIERDANRSRCFFDIFNIPDIPEHIRTSLQNAVVKGITHLKQENALEIDILTPYIVDSPTLFEIEKLIALHVLKDPTFKIRILPEFVNVSSMTPIELFESYRDNILWEVEHRGGNIRVLAQFYDYLEIQPIGNNHFMILNDTDYPDIQTEEDLQNLNRQIVRLGEELQKPVVATCDVHFLNPEDEVYRRIILSSMKYKDVDNQAPLYFRTTEEMLEEFSYLGSEKAEEVVITNSNKIAEQIEAISPVRPDNCPPVIENSDTTLREICTKRAHELYGETLPAIVKERMNKELDAIISNGYAVMYIIAQKLVWKSVEDGYFRFRPSIGMVKYPQMVWGSR